MDGGLVDACIGCQSRVVLARCCRNVGRGAPTVRIWMKFWLESCFLLLADMDERRLSL